MWSDSQADLHDTSDQVRLTYRVAHGGEACEQEVQLAVQFIDQHGLPSFCRVVLNSNDFRYVRCWNKRQPMGGHQSIAIWL